MQEGVFEGRLVQSGQRRSAGMASMSRSIFNSGARRQRFNHDVFSIFTLPALCHPICSRINHLGCHFMP